MTDQNVLPEVDEARIKAIFHELEGMEVELDPDPLAYGPKRLNKKVARARGMLTRCERVFLQVSHDLQMYKRSHRTTELDFNLQMQDLYANDPEVRAGRNVRDREALATMKLRDQREEIMDLEIGIQDLEMVMSVIKAKRADLRDIQNRLKDQMKLCQEEINLGSKWGSKPPPGIDGPDLSSAPKTDPQALANLQALVEETGGSEAGETHVDGDTPGWMEESDDSDMDDLFDQVNGDEDDEDDEDEMESEDDDAQDDSEVGAEEEGVESETTNLLQSDEVEDLGDTTLEPEEEAKVEAAVEQAEKDIEEAKAESEPEAAEEADIDDILNEVTTEPEEPQPDPEPEAPAEPEADMADIFSDDGEPSRDDKVPEVKSDAEVDDYFAQLDAKPAKSKKDKKQSAELADEDLDDLIDLFGE